MNKQEGFSLLEAMISSAIIGVGLVGVVSLTAFSENYMQRSVIRHKMQMVADNMMEVIESDLSNIDSYTMDFTACPSAVEGAATYQVRRFEWCQTMDDKLGIATVNEIRRIVVTTQSDGKRAVEILLEDSDGATQIVMKRLFDVD